jgi:hypothetical protein
MPKPKRPAPPAPIVLEMPPLPRLAGDGCDWSGTVSLSSWRTVVPLQIAGEEGRLPSPSHLAAFSYLMEHERAIAAVVRRALLRDARRVTARLSPIDGVRPVKTEADLRRRLRLTRVFLHDQSLAGVAYCGLTFRCDWDDEHGAGVLLHRRRVVRAGDAQLATHPGVMKADADRHGSTSRR